MILTSFLSTFHKMNRYHIDNLTIVAFGHRYTDSFTIIIPKAVKGNLIVSRQWH